MLFIDGANLYHGGKGYEHGYRTDILELRDILTEGLDLIRGYYFDSFQPGNRKEGFYKKLEMSGFRVEAKPLRERNGDYVEKGTDIALATEMIAQGFEDSYDVAVMVSGDDDYAKAIRYVQDQGKVVKLASFENNASSDVKKRVDEYISLNEYADELRRS
jgi:uncharacterized LabA/DUF88 family protein